MESNAPEEPSAQGESCLLFAYPTFLRRLVGSGWLTVPDAGRLLILTSKQVTLAFLGADDNDDLVWRTLFSMHWGDSPALQNWMATTGESAASGFRRLCYPETIGEDPGRSLPDLKYSPSDYVVTVKSWYAESLGFFGSVRNLTWRPLFCHVVPGANIPEFFADGECQITLPSPIQFPCAFDPSKKRVRLRWRGEGNMLRLLDQKTLSLFKFDVSSELALDDASNEWTVLDRHVLFGEENMFVAPQPNLIPIIKQAFFDLESCDFGFPVKVTLGLRISTVTAPVDGHADMTPTGLRLKTSSLIPCVGGFRLDVVHLYNYPTGAQCETFSEARRELEEYIREQDEDANYTSAIQFAHILEALPGWHAG